jgi:hypothetical protein
MIEMNTREQEFYLTVKNSLVVLFRQSQNLVKEPF